jgi:hypothetical protein
MEQKVAWGCAAGVAGNAFDLCIACRVTEIQPALPGMGARQTCSIVRKLKTLPQTLTSNFVPNGQILAWCRRCAFARGYWHCNSANQKKLQLI